MTVFLLLAAAAAACWIVVTARRQSRHARPGQSIEGFHRALDALSGDRERRRR